MRVCFSGVLLWALCIPIAGYAQEHEFGEMKDTQIANVDVADIQWEKDSEICMAEVEKLLAGVSQKTIDKYTQTLFYNCLIEKGYRFEAQQY